MPCNTYQGNDSEFHERYGTNDPDKLADMLCRVLTCSYQGWYQDECPEDVKQWWNKHQEWDAERKKK